MQNTLDITKYIDMAIRRKWWIIIPFLIVVLGGMFYALKAPRIYQAETLILVEPPKVPSEYVRPIVSGNVEDRLQTITQQVTSRTNLEKIIRQFNLYDIPGKHLFMDDKVAIFRKMITVDVSHRGRRSEASAFSISFRGRDPKIVAEVTNTLASNFITQNLKIREAEAVGTSSFLANELNSVKKRLRQKEEELKKYRMKYMGGLPEQLQTNLSILERLQAQLDQYNENLRNAEDRKILLQQQIADARANASTQTATAGPTSSTQRDELQRLKDELAVLESKYTEDHPDVIRLKKTISKMEAARPRVAESAPSRSDSEPPGMNIDQTLKRQLEETDLEINRLKGEIANLNAQIKTYQKRVEDTPKREQELLALNRDYENLKELYNSLLSRKLEAEIAVSLEKKQKGEQFRILDPAKVPSRPIKPDMRKIALMTLVLSLGLGGGLAYLVEMMDTSFKDPDEVEEVLKLPVLLTLPIRYTERELKRMKLRKILAYASVSIGFVASVMGILIATKGLYKTLQLFADLMK